MAVLITLSLTGPGSQTRAEHLPPLLDSSYRAEYEEMQPTTTAKSLKGIYGRDNRIEVYMGKPSARRAVNATGALLFPDTLAMDKTDRRYRIRQSSTLVDDGWCAEEPFSRQPRAAFCTGLLVGPDLFATAGHCVNERKTSFPATAVHVVFGFHMLNESDARQAFPEKDVYGISEVIALRHDGEADWAVVRLDRAVSGREPLAVSEAAIDEGTDLTVVGHPNGLPAKVADGGTVRRSGANETFFWTDLDAYGGNSGSPVFSTASILAGTPKVAGILVSGATDYRLADGCKVSDRCDRTSFQQHGYCTGERVTKGANIARVLQAGRVDDEAGQESPADIHDTLPGLKAIAEQLE